MSHVLIDTPTSAEQRDALAQATGLPVVVAAGDLGKQRELPSEQLASATHFLATYLPHNHAQMTSLELMQLCSAGFKQVENLGLSQRNLVVCTAAGVSDIPIAEWAVMMMLALQRDLPGLLRNQAVGAWDRDARFQSEVHGKTLGLWGYGGSARATARLAQALGMRIHALTRRGQVDPRPRYQADDTAGLPDVAPDRLFAADQVEAFCADLDFLMLAIPETPKNLGLIDAGVFKALPNHAYLLNPRGKLVNEADLLHALRSGQIAGAGLDTHFQYPLPPEHPLWQMPNVIMSPHIAGSSGNPNATPRLLRLFTENITRFRKSQPLFGQLRADQLDPAGG